MDNFASCRISSPTLVQLSAGVADGAALAVNPSICMFTQPTLGTPFKVSLERNEIVLLVQDHHPTCSHKDMGPDVNLTKHGVPEALRF